MSPRAGLGGVRGNGGERRWTGDRQAQPRDGELPSHDVSAEVDVLSSVLKLYTAVCESCSSTRAPPFALPLDAVHPLALAPALQSFTSHFPRHGWRDRGKRKGLLRGGGDVGGSGRRCVRGVVASIRCGGEEGSRDARRARVVATGPYRHASAKGVLAESRIGSSTEPIRTRPAPR